MKRISTPFALIVITLSLWGGGQVVGDILPWRHKDKAASSEPVSVEPSVLNLQDSFANVAAKVKPATVNITSVHVESFQAQPQQFFFGDPFEMFDDIFGPRVRPQGPPRTFQRQYQGMGSGVVVDPKGYILTNDHVVHGATEIHVRLPDSGDKVYKGKVVGMDPRSDLAVVKIDPKGDLPYLAIGDSDNVRVGDWAVAVGSPFGLEQTVTVGIISAMRQTLTIEGKSFSNMLQTDAAINRGNSGGPLVNIRGEIIGINTAIYAPTGVFSGVGFAIPGNVAKDIMSQLIEKGRVVRGWLGVEIGALDDVLARQFRVPDGKGVLINRVLPGSPAAKAGLQRGDVVLEFNGTKVDSPAALQGVVAKTAPEKNVKLVVVRNGEKKELSLTTEKMPDESASSASEESREASDEKDAFAWEGGRFVTASSELSERYGYAQEAKGVVAVRVEGMAAQLGLSVGDVIASVNGQETPDLGTFKNAVKRVDLKDGVVLDVNRRGRWIYISYQKPG